MKAFVKAKAVVAAHGEMRYCCAMFIERAYAERESLSDNELERLRAGLADQVQRYEQTIRNYPPDRMERHGRPFLNRLREKVDAVDALIANRAKAD